MFRPEKTLGDRAMILNNAYTSKELLGQTSPAGGIEGKNTLLSWTLQHVKAE
jgi:hypothetical protein